MGMEVFLILQPTQKEIKEKVHGVLKEEKTFGIVVKMRVVVGKG